MFFGLRRSRSTASESDRQLDSVDGRRCRAWRQSLSGRLRLALTKIKWPNRRLTPIS